METSKLLEYLAIIIDLEKNKLTQEETLIAINSNMSSYRTEYGDNVKLNDAINKSNNIKKIEVDKSGKGFFYFMTSCMSCMGINVCISTYNATHSLKLALPLGVIGSLVFGGIPIIIWNIILQKRRECVTNQVHQGMKAEKELMQSREVRNKKISIALSKLTLESKAMQETYMLTCQALKKCYDINIIPIKYRGIVPVCMFYDYILNGRTYSLQKNLSAFDEGAINMYEKELIYQRIEGKLDVIINNLESLKQGQKVLYNAIQDGNQKTHQMLNDINSSIFKVNGSLQTIQYQNEQRNKCLEYMSYVTYQRYMSR